MNYDAQEAALGLLSLSPSTTFIQPVPLVTPNPLKRKQNPQVNHQPPQRPNPSKGRSKQAIVAEREKEKQKSKEDVDGDAGDISSESIRCICGSTFDDGFSIACDDCSRWCHAACFDIAEGSVPEQWSCWVCVPRPIDRDRATRLQRSRQRAMEDAERERLTLLSQPQQQRRTSPGVERKHRRVSAPAIEGSKKRRRMSTVSTQPPPVNTQPSNLHPSAGEDTPVDVCTDADEPRSHYVHITEDIVASSSTTAKLRQHAQNWRGITALTPYPPPRNSTPITLQPLPSEPTSVRPPSYALHTTSPVPSDTFLAPFPSTITPSAEYLSDPLNGYAHLGMPKPHVHLMGPPLDLALDARVTGNETRFVRSGCWPNAVLRPVLCKQSREEERRKEKTWRSEARSRPVGAGDRETQGREDRRKADEETTLGFAVFALRDLKANEEVVLGWEWDDGNAVHALPALLQTPHMFPPAHVQHLRSQLSNILHALGSTFTTCACGERAKGCAIREMEAFVEGGEQTGMGGRIPVGAERGRDGLGTNDEGMDRDQGNQHPEASHQNQQHDSDQQQRQRQHHHRPATLHDTSVNPAVAGPSTLRAPTPPSRPVDLGPLLGVERGFRTRERVAWAGGMGGVEMVGGMREGYGGMRPKPSRSRGSRTDRRRSGSGIRMVVDDEVWDEEGDVDVEGEEEGVGGQDRGEEDEVNVDGTVDRRVGGDDEFSSNRAMRPALKASDPQRKPRLPDAGVFRLRAEDGGSQRVRIIVPGEGVGWDSGGEYNLGPDWGKDELPEGVDEEADDEEEVVESEPEEKMPPKMRKRWMHQELEALREMYGFASGSGSASGTGSDVGLGERGALSPAIEGVSGAAKGGSEERGTDEGTSLGPHAAGGRAEDATLDTEMDVDIQDTPPPPPPAASTPTPNIPPSPLRGKHHDRQPKSPGSFRGSPQTGAADSTTTPTLPTPSPSMSFSRLSLVSPIVSSQFTSAQAGSPQVLGCDVPPHTRLRLQDILSEQIPTHRGLEDEQPEIPAEIDVQPPSPLSTCSSPPHRPLAPPSPRASTPPRSNDSLGFSVADRPTTAVTHEVILSPASPIYRPDIRPEPTLDSPMDDPMNEPSGSVAIEDPIHEAQEHSSPLSVSEPHAPTAQSPLPDSPESPPLQRSPTPTPPPCVLIPPPWYSPTPSPSPTPPPPPSPPPPPPKVKMSLKDFAARKKKQREELESVGGGSMEASPMVVESALAPDTDGDARLDRPEPMSSEPVAGPSKPVPVVAETLKEAEAPIVKTAGREALDVVTNGQIKDEDVEMSVDTPERPHVSSPTIPAGSSDRPTLVPTSPAPSTPPVVSLRAKMELVDQGLPERRTTSPHPTPRASILPAPVLRPPPPPHLPHEEGEIPVHQDDKQPVTQRPPARTSFFPPHTHTPPTQPRSFQTTPGYSPPPRSHPPFRTPLGTPTPPPTTPMVPPSSRPLPSGPRALRMSSQSYQPARPASRSFSGPQALPRGPSADRDRMDWDRDRSWQPRARTRGGGWAR